MMTVRTGPGALAVASLLLAGTWSAAAADLPERYGYAPPQIKAYRTTRPICVEEYGPDAPPYGYGCLDHWVKIRRSTEVIQDNGYGYRVASEQIIRRYPPQYYAPGYLDREIVVLDSEPSVLGCPSCEGW